MLLNTKLSAVALKAKLFRGLADASRLAILDTLRAEPRTVTQIVEETSLTQSNVSNHLACLLDCGLIVRETQGRFAYYQLSDERVRTLLVTCDELLAEVAKGVYECVHYRTPDDKVVLPEEKKAEEDL
jgi:ArsR family transcriptional regulator, cadmium/lead-responsive transcriptional repressor